MANDARTDAAPRERRRTQRVPFAHRIRVWTAEGGAYRATGKNLSEQGMLLHTSSDQIVASDRLLRLTFNLPQVVTPLQVEAAVVHTHRDGQRVSVGLYFMMVPSVIRRMLRTFVATGCGRIRDYNPYPDALGL